MVETLRFDEPLRLDHLTCLLKSGIRPDPSQIHQPLLVCTAHIHWDPQYCDVKLVQTMMLMNEVLRAIET